LYSNYHIPNIFHIYLNIYIYFSFLSCPKLTAVKLERVLLLLLSFKLCVPRFVLVNSKSIISESSSSSSSYIYIIYIILYKHTTIYNSIYNISYYIYNSIYNIHHIIYIILYTFIICCIIYYIYSRNINII
jgi:hypothetical protein